MITAVPTLLPVTIPVLPTLATIVPELLQVPPDKLHDSVVVPPRQMLVLPVMPGRPAGVTVIVLNARATPQPLVTL